MELEGLDHVALYCADVARAAAWYQEVLGLARAYEHAWGDVPTVMVARGSGVALFPARAAPHARERAPLAFAHVAFRTSARGLADAKRALAEKRIGFEEQDHGIARSISVRDPDGHEVEITTYEVA